MCSVSGLIISSGVLPLLWELHFSSYTCCLFLTGIIFFSILIYFLFKLAYWLFTFKAAQSGETEPYFSVGLT